MPMQTLNLPVPGTMVKASESLEAAVLRGLKVNPEEPFQFEFVLDPGQEKFSQPEMSEQAERMIRYFFAALTIPEKDLWVNLSPQEKDRVVPDELGQTDLGRDMLTQDYLLKQFTATLTYPEEDLGKAFWDKIYKTAYEKFGTTQIPLDAFNKVWIVPEHADVYEDEKSNAAYILKSRLKVLSEEDYLAFKANTPTAAISQNSAGELNQLSCDVIKEVIVPVISKEINEGKQFAALRQIYHALILAAWYKKALQESLLYQAYVDQKKIEGVDLTDKQLKEKIYEQYIQAYKKGIYDYIKEEYDPAAREQVPRRYISGGEEWTVSSTTSFVGHDAFMLSAGSDDLQAVKVGIQIGGGENESFMLVKDFDETQVVRMAPMLPVHLEVNSKNDSLAYEVSQAKLDEYFSRAAENMTQPEILRRIRFVPSPKNVAEVKKLGHGGLGDVFEAQEYTIDQNGMKHVGRSLAVKVRKKADYPEKEKRVERIFYDEADALNVISHQENRFLKMHFSELFYQGDNFIVLSLEEGYRLKQVIDPRPGDPQLSLPDQYDIMVQMMSAYYELHKIGYLHYDVSPKNMIWDPQTRILKIIDLGLIRQLGQKEQRKFLYRISQGTPIFQAPEVIDHEYASSIGKPWNHFQYDPGLDIYSLGISLWELFLGETPYKYFLQKDFNKIKNDNTLIDLINKDVRIPAEIKPILIKALAPNPKDRYQTVQEMMDDVVKIVPDSRYLEENEDAFDGRYEVKLPEVKLPEVKPQELPSLVEVLEQNHGEHRDLAVRAKTIEITNNYDIDGVNEQLKRLGEPLEVLGLEQGSAAGMNVVYKAKYSPVKGEEVLVLLKVVKRSPEFSKEVAADLQNALENEIGFLKYLKDQKLTSASAFPTFILEGGNYLVMEYIDGMNLDQIFHPEVEPESFESGMTTQKANLIVQSMSVLQQAHELNIIHRDIKPANLMIGPSGRSVLLDFGLAGVMGQPMTTIVGSPNYIAPEVFGLYDGTEVVNTVEMDIYSLGILIYEAIFQETPFTELEAKLQELQDRANEQEEKGQLFNQFILTLWQMKSRGPARDANLMTLTAEQRQFLLTALAPNPEDRFSSVAAMAKEFMDAFPEFEFSLADRKILLAALEDLSQMDTRLDGKDASAIADEQESIDALMLSTESRDGEYKIYKDLDRPGHISINDKDNIPQLILKFTSADQAKIELLDKFADLSGPIVIPYQNGGALVLTKNMDAAITVFEIDGAQESVVQIRFDDQGGLYSASKESMRVLLDKSPSQFDLTTVYYLNLIWNAVDERLKSMVSLIAFRIQRRYLTIKNERSDKVNSTTVYTEPGRLHVFADNIKTYFLKRILQNEKPWTISDYGSSTSITSLDIVNALIGQDVLIETSDFVVYLRVRRIGDAIYVYDSHGNLYQEIQSGGVVKIFGEDRKTDKRFLELDKNDKTGYFEFSRTAPEVSQYINTQQTPRLILAERDVFDQRLPKNHTDIGSLFNMVAATTGDENLFKELLMNLARTIKNDGYFAFGFSGDPETQGLLYDVWHRTGARLVKMDFIKERVVVDKSYDVIDLTGIEVDDDAHLASITRQDGTILTVFYDGEAPSRLELVAPDGREITDATAIRDFLASVEEMEGEVSGEPLKKFIQNYLLPLTRQSQAQEQRQSNDFLLLSGEKTPGGLDFETVGDKIKANGQRIKILTKDPQQVRDILGAKTFHPVVYSITPIPAGGLTKYLFSMN